MQERQYVSFLVRLSFWRETRKFQVQTWSVISSFSGDALAHKLSLEASTGGVASTGVPALVAVTAEQVLLSIETVWCPAEAQQNYEKRRLD